MVLLVLCIYLVHTYLTVQEWQRANRKISREKREWTVREQDRQMYKKNFDVTLFYEIIYFYLVILKILHTGM